MKNTRMMSPETMRSSLLPPLSRLSRKDGIVIELCETSV